MKLFWAPQTGAQRGIWMPDSRNLGAYADRCLARPANQRALWKGAA